MTAPNVAIIGAGISGLACAHRLTELAPEGFSPANLCLFDASPGPGGTIQTGIRDGFVLEKGPDSFLSEKPFAVELCRRIGIENEIIGTQNKNRKIFVVKNGRLLPLPDGFHLIAPIDPVAFLRSPLFSFRGKLRAACEPWVSAQNGANDESIGHFIRRRFGREILETVGQPMMGGIYAGDPETLSLQQTLPRFAELERKHGSVTKGLRASAGQRRGTAGSTGPRYSLFLSFKQGMQTLTDALAARLKGKCDFRFSSPIADIRRKGSRWELIEKKGETHIFDAVCLTVPAWQTARFLKTSTPALSAKLNDISYESVATINLVFKKEQIGHALDSFGFVVPAKEKRSLIACTFSSQKFSGRAPDDKVLLRGFAGGYAGHEYFDMDDERLTEAVQKDISVLLRIKGAAEFVSVARYPRSMVQYRVGHRELVENIFSETDLHQGLFLAGSAYRGIGIPDCIREGEKTAEAIYERFCAHSSAG